MGRVNDSAISCGDGALVEARIRVGGGEEEIRFGGGGEEEIRFGGGGEEEIRFGVGGEEEDGATAGEGVDYEGEGSI